MADTAPGSARQRLGRQLAGYRRAAGHSQQTFAALVRYTRSSIANVETGRQCPPRAFWVQCDELLGTGGMLAAGHDAHIAEVQLQQRVTAQRLSPLGEVSAATMSPYASAAPGLAEPPAVPRSLIRDMAVSNEFPVPEPADPATHAIPARAELLLRLVYKLDAEQGGNALLAPVAQYVARLAPHAETDPDRHLHTFGQLSQLAGWLALESNQHGAARRYWSTAVYAAHEADDPALAAGVLAYMNLQDTYRLRAKSALSLARTAFETADGSTTPLVRTMLATRLARANAALGNKAASLRALDRARTAFAAAAPTPEPLWAGYVDEVELAAQEGACYLEPRMSREARQAIGRALRLLDQNAPHRVRDAVHYLARLAKCHLIEYDVDGACAVAGDALARATALGSARVATRLDDFRSALEPFGSSRAVRTFRDQHAAATAR
ncbi:hypothetical protein GCM10010123_05370 [Pilimelia anulata]|uniref:Uncharacterized protein n=1 Tax=Pilimelia anulata TaxID=53371 RepID=A0A8J3B706_9ACTN|nr:helix-turn-helix transcriptional regulator [Pilimelia anulata]GGJ78312.1 hypothetical protein GCM10010123_05370 [Pilimelia anulata]